MNDRPNIRRNGTGMTISIGAMSRATGIPTNTLRTWERRYGFPQPQRTDSGQRVYDASLIGHLRLVATALERGHRPSQILGISEAQLQTLLGQAQSTDIPATLSASEQVIESWLTACRDLDGVALDGGFRTEAARLGMLRFLTERVGPFLVALGESWRRGDIEVYQEHWSTERLRRFLAEAWEPLAKDATGPTIVAATLPGDRHDLGLHMAVAVASMCGWQIVFLGRDTPVDDISAAIGKRSASAALLSISAWADPVLSLGHLRQLRTRLSDDISIVIGGTGAPDMVPGVTTLHGLEALFNWASGTTNEDG